MRFAISASTLSKRWSQKLKGVDFKTAMRAGQVKIRVLKGKKILGRMRTPAKNQGRTTAKNQVQVLLRKRRSQQQQLLFRRVQLAPPPTTPRRSSLTSHFSVSDTSTI